ncbi:MAG TPA: hypothetical protein VKA01_18105 [Vicinamibacteria bacterium]|nr:hypothetical protein [Vicinamibacteria bacterium]
MTPTDVIVATLTATLLGVTLAGLVARDRVRLCRSFAGLLAATLLCNQLITHLPQRFWNSTFWTFKEGLYAGLYCATVLELALLVFAGLPRAKRPLLAAMTTVILAVAVLVATTDLERTNLVRTVISGFNAAAAWLAAMLVIAVIFYRLPLHPFHRLVLFGIGFHLSLYSMLLGPIADGWSAMRAYVNALDRVVYFVTLSLWLWAAWRREPAQALTGEAAAVLQPWAARA